MIRYSQEFKQKIRNMVKAGMSKYQASRETGVAYITVCKLTKDLPSKLSGNRELGGKSIKILQKMLKNGYCVPKGIQSAENYYQALRKHFPVEKVNFRGRTIYFLEGRNEEAFSGFMRLYGKRVTNYNALSELAGLFGVSLSSEMRQEVIGNSKIGKSKGWRLRRCEKQALRRLKPQNSSFIGNFLHSELL